MPIKNSETMKVNKSEYNKMVDDLEELEDIKLHDSAKEGEQEFL